MDRLVLLQCGRLNPFLQAVEVRDDAIRTFTKLIAELTCITITATNDYTTTNTTQMMMIEHLLAHCK